MRALLFVLILSSCGDMIPSDVVEATNPRQFNSTDDVFTQYVETFEIETGHNVVDVPINFGDTRLGQSVGVCYKWSRSGKREIIISESHWNKASDNCKEVIIDHELGHCTLNRAHHNEVYKGVHVSVMNSSVINCRKFGTLKAEYYTELKHNDSTDIKLVIDNLKEMI